MRRRQFRRPQSALSDYGAVRFHAESVHRGMLQNPGDHSHYFDPDSASLYNITDVVTGHGNHILHDNMQAAGRTQDAFSDKIDPEWDYHPVGVNH